MSTVAIRQLGWPFSTYLPFLLEFFRWCWGCPGSCRVTCFCGMCCHYSRVWLLLNFDNKCWVMSVIGLKYVCISAVFVPFLPAEFRARNKVLRPADHDIHACVTLALQCFDCPSGMWRDLPRLSMVCIQYTVYPTMHSARKGLYLFVCLFRARLFWSAILGRDKQIHKFKHNKRWN